MKGSRIEAVVKESNENGDIHIRILMDDDLTCEEMLAAAGCIVTEFVKVADGNLDILDFVSAILKVNSKCS
jgi:hypothetical protein